MPTSALTPLHLLAACAAWAGVTGLVHAADGPVDDRRALTLSAQGDSHRGRAASAALTLPVAERGWVRLGAGRSRWQDATGTWLQPNQLSVAGGYRGDGWGASLGAATRQDTGRLRQHDLEATVERQAAYWTAGVDASWRHAQQTTPGTLASTATTQRLRGTGLGLHGSLQVAQPLSLHAAFMRYHHTVRSDAPAAPGLLTPVFGNASFLNRDEAALSRSAGAGATWQFSQAAVTAEVLADRVLNTPGTLRTVQLKAGLDVAPQWTLSPTVGRSRGAGQPSATFAGLTARMGW